MQARWRTKRFPTGEFRKVGGGWGWPLEHDERSDGRTYLFNADAFAAFAPMDLGPCLSQRLCQRPLGPGNDGRSLASGGLGGTRGLTAGLTAGLATSLGGSVVTDDGDEEQRLAEAHLAEALRLVSLNGQGGGSGGGVSQAPSQWLVFVDHMCVRVFQSAHLSSRAHLRCTAKRPVGAGVMFFNFLAG